MSDQTSYEPIPEGGEVTELALGRRFFNWKTFASFVVAFLIIFFLMRNVKMDPAATLATIRRADPLLYLTGFLVYYAGFLIRGLRWQRMMRNVRGEDDAAVAQPSAKRLAAIIYVSWFVNCIVPAKLGDVVRGYLLRNDTGIRFMKGMGTIVAERLLDLSVLLLLLGVSGWVSMRDRLPADVQRALELGMLLVGAGVLVLLLMRHQDSIIQRFLPERMRERYSRFNEGTLGSFRSLPYISFLTVLTWLSESARLLFVTWALGVHISDNPVNEALAIVFIALASAALTALPVTPGGLGLVEALIVKAFSWSAAASGAHIANDVVWSIAILDRSISYGSIVVFGLIVYYITAKRQKTRERL